MEIKNICCVGAGAGYVGAPTMSVIMRKYVGENRRLVTVVNDPYHAADRAHVIAVLTEWKPALAFDGRKLLGGNDLSGIGFQYYAIGE